MLKFLLFAQLLYDVNQVHFPWLQTGIPAVAPTNVIFLFTLWAMKDQVDMLQPRPEGFLRPAIIYFFGIALTYGLLWAQIRAFNDPVADLTYWKNGVFYPLLYFMYLRCKQDEKTTRQLIIWVLVIAAVAGLEAFREGLDYGFGKYNPTHRASGPFGTDWRGANPAGVFFGMFMPMFLSLALFLRKRKLWRLAATFGTFLLLAGAISTYSRQSYILCLLGASILLLRRNFVIAIIIGAILVSLVGLLPDAATQRVQETEQVDDKGNEQVDVSTASRWEIWEGGMKAWAHNPLGVGLNRFHTEVGNYAPKHKDRDAHNFYVLTAVDCGPLGILTLLWLHISIFRFGRFLRNNARKDDPEIQALTLGFTVCAVNMALGAIYGSPTLIGEVMGPFWALAGLLERYVLLQAQNASHGAGKPVAAEPALVERFPLAAYIAPGQRR